MSNRVLERNGQVTACRQISTAKAWSGQVSWVSREDSSLLVFEMVEKKAKKRAKPGLWPAISVESLGGSLENLGFLLGFQGHSQKQGRVMCILEGSVVPASGQTADRDIRGSHPVFCEWRKARC